MKRNTKKIIIFLETSSVIRWIILMAVMAVFTVILYPNLMAQKHYYIVGDIAESDIKAPRDFFIKDNTATETKRQEVMDEVLTIYDYDPTFLPKLTRQTRQGFEKIQAIFETAKKETHQSPPKTNTPAPAVTADANTSVKISIHDQIWDMKPAFEEELGISVSDEAFKLLEKEAFDPIIVDIVIRIITHILENGVVANKEILLREGEKGIVLRHLDTKKEEVVRNLKKFYGPDQYKEMVRIIGKPLVRNLNPNLVPVIVDFSQRLIQPNITLNRSETEKRKKQAANLFEPISYKIKEGEMLLREGERITKEQLLKLDVLNSQKKREKIYVKALGALLTIFVMILIFYFLHINHQKQDLQNRNKDALFMASILILFSVLPKISDFLLDALPQHIFLSISVSSVTFAIPIAAAGMTICLFMGLDVAIFFSMIVAVCTAVIFQNRFEIFLYFLFSSIMGAYWLQNCKERKVFIKAGVKLGILNAAGAAAVSIYMGDYAGLKLMWDWAFAFMGGIVSGIVTAGLAPLLEMAFRYTTDISLLELANLEQPILRRLMLEAPGTYHHSVIVGSMVEAAAAEIGANPLLAKVCGYYHDIGKIKKPLYFIENQTDGKNRHDKLAPSMSSLILISHVKEGVEMAKTYKLGQVIIDAIRQHHGTSLISFFYEKAKQLRGEDAVKIEDFCYPGPRPQTREAGLVMLADVVEAASRTLENPTPSRIRGHVQRLINKIFSDGQLDNCELTLKDLHNIAKSFNKILNGIHHHRIEYPENGKDKKEAKEKEVKEKKEEKSDSPVQQQSKQTTDPYGKITDDNSASLKRLGML